MVIAIVLAAMYRGGGGGGESESFYSRSVHLVCIKK